MPMPCTAMLCRIMLRDWACICCWISCSGLGWSSPKALTADCHMDRSCSLAWGAITALAEGGGGDESGESMPAIETTEAIVGGDEGEVCVCDIGMLVLLMILMWLWLLFLVLSVISAEVAID